MDEKLGRYEFDDRLTRGEKIFLWIYLPLHAVGLPLLLNYLQHFMSGGISDVNLNFMYYAFGALLMLGFLFRYLRRGFYTLCDRLLPCLFSVLVGYMIVTMLNLAISGLVISLEGKLQNTNNTAVDILAAEGWGKTMAMAVFLAPLVEEPLFRAGIFGTIRKKHRVLAYVVTILVFGLYHVWQPLVVYGSPVYLLLIVEYIPAGLALCWAYDRTGTIWTPIFLHMLINWLNLMALSMTQAG